MTVEADVVIGRGGDRDLHADIYHPPGSDRDRPCVVLVHGGGWRQGDRTQLRAYGLRLARAGYVCVAPEYRLTPEAPWPAQIHDVHTAMAWVRANVDRLGVDAARVAIEGHSAGAHLALLVAGAAHVPEFAPADGHDPEAAVAAVIAVYPPTLLSHGQRAKGAVPLGALTEDPGADDDTAALASPLTHVAAGFPPTMIVHGGADTVVPPRASTLLYDALVAVGVPADLHMYAELPHAFDADPTFARQCAAEMVLFLDRYLASHPR
ncbi:MAG: alpha/beta hydrolase fold domain-containing protein [Acidimicrobiales bacterium]